MGLIPPELTEEEANAQLERMGRLQRLQQEEQLSSLSPMLGRTTPKQPSGSGPTGTFENSNRRDLPQRLFSPGVLVRIAEETDFRDRWIEKQALQQGVNRTCQGDECTGWVSEWYGPLDLSKPGVGFIKKPCPTCPLGFRWEEEEIARANNEKVKEYRQSMIKGSGLPVEGRFKDKTLATFGGTRNGKSEWYKAFMKWVKESWIEGTGQEDKTGACLLGGYGVGKTGLAIGLGLELVDRLEVRVLYMNVADFTEQIGRAWAAKDGSDYVLIDRMKTRQLLILNDLGAGHGSAKDWDDKSPMQHLFNILDTRYNNGLPVVITSNCETVEALKAIIGLRNFNRIFDSCKLFLCTGQNLRKGIA
jgi:DNA replication protein DnaC